MIAATNVDLLDRVKKGKFREDLYYRLSTVPISVPSLKERDNDIPVLFRKFASDFADKYKTSPIRLDDRAEIVIENYSWPGNIRELKNVVEQLSVLSEEKEITADILVDFLPHLMQRNLPAIQDSDSKDAFKEREILYKLLFEMKGDLNDLKSLVFEMIKANNLRVPANASLLTAPKSDFEKPNFRERSDLQVPDRPNYDFETEQNDEDRNGNYPIILDASNSPYSNSEVVEENLSIRDMEKDLIEKALSKHKNRRKDAADELGISERTLYRKIKEYEI